MKLLVKLAVAVAVLLLLGLGAVVLLRDRGLIRLIETAGSRGTGQATTVDAVSTGILSGDLTIDGLQVANPAGFGDEPFLRLGGIDLAVPYSKLSEDPIRIGLIDVEGLELRLIRKGTELNYEPILDHLESLAGDGGADPEPVPEEPAPEAGGPGKTVVIDQLRIANWRLLLDVGQPVVGPQEVGMGELVIRDLQVTGEDALNLAVGRVLDELIQAALERAPGLPAELAPFVDALRGALADGAHLEDVDALLEEARSQAEQLAAEKQAELTDAAEAKLNAQLEDVTDELQQELEETLGKELGEQAAPKIDEAKKALGNLLGGNKSDGG